MAGLSDGAHTPPTEKMPYYMNYLNIQIAIGEISNQKLIAFSLDPSVRHWAKFRYEKDG